MRSSSRRAVALVLGATAAAEKRLPHIESGCPHTRAAPRQPLRRAAMASFDTLNYAKWDSLECSSDDEPQQVRIDRRSHGAATIRSDGSKAYSVQMSTSQGPCVVEEDAVRRQRPALRDAARLAEYNRENMDTNKRYLPRLTASAAFFEEEVELRIKGMDPVKFAASTSHREGLHVRPGREALPRISTSKKCLALELRKKQQQLVAPECFWRGHVRFTKSGEEIECAWRSGKEMLATTP